MEGVDVGGEFVVGVLFVECWVGGEVGYVGLDVVCGGVVVFWVLCFCGVFVLCLVWGCYVFKVLVFIVC